MPKLVRKPLPITFPGVEEPLRGQLERFAREVQARIDESTPDDVRPLAGSTEPLGAGGTYYLEAGTVPVDRELPNLSADEAGKQIVLIRRERVGTAVVRAQAPATINGEQLDYLPAGVGTYRLTYDGANWFWDGLPPLLTRGYEWSADQLKGGPFAAGLGVSGSATLIPDPVQTGVTVRGFGSQGHDAVRREFFVPTGAQGSLTLRSYFRAQSGPTGHAVVHRRLQARQFADGTGIPSGYTVYTLPSVTMPSGVSPWRYKEDQIPLNALGISQGRVEVVFSRPSASPYASPDLDSMLLVESLTLEIPL